jgi:hypothetical protein
MGNHVGTIFPTLYNFKLVFEIKSRSITHVILFVQTLKIECGTPGYLVCWDPFKNFFFSNTGIWIQDLILAQQVFYHLRPSISPFGVRYFEDMALLTLFTSWLGTAILLTSDSKLARITGGNHQFPAHSNVPGVSSE